MFKRLYEELYNILEFEDKDDFIAKIFNYFIIILIILNIITVSLDTFEELHRYSDYFKKFEVFSVIVFTIEYLLRLITSRLKYRSKNFFIDIIKYIVSPMAIIDLIAILPFYLPMFISFDLRVLRILRLVRLIRIFKLNRYTESFAIISKVITKKKEELVASVFLMSIMLIIASSLMYYFESEAQPDKFTNIATSLWWAVATLTTVGYGDIYPITTLGRILAAIIALLGIGLVALPTGIISSGFIEAINEKKQNSKKRCPHCGKIIE